MNPDLHFTRRLAGIGAGILAFLLFLTLSRLPTVAEMLFGAIGPTLSSGLSRITGLVSFSLAELVIVAFVVRQLWGATRGWRDLRDGARTVSNAAAAGALRLASDIGIIVALFYLLWGFHYARSPLSARLGWDSETIGPGEVRKLAQEMVEAANFAYVSVHGSDDHGEPTVLEMERAELFDSLREGWEPAESILGPAPLPVFGFGDPKPLASSRLLDYMGVSGFYFPWTGEANFNRGIPAPTLPHALAHEMAHQRGYAREDEANFVGFLVAATAEGDSVRYSAYLFAQRQLIGAVARTDLEAAQELVGQRLAGVQRDIDAVREYWERFEGPASQAARRVNDAYLRTNRVPGGILNYGRSVELLVAYSRSRGGWILRRERD